MRAGHQQGVVLVQAADVLAVVGRGGGGVHLAGVERGLLGPVVMDVDAVEGEPVLTRRLVESVGHLKPASEDRLVHDSCLLNVTMQRMFLCSSLCTIA